MPSAHETHASIELAAAAVLALGGAAILGRAWVDRRLGRPGRTSSVGDTSGGDADDGAERIDRTLRRLVAVLSLTAAVIHLAAAPEHVADLGDVGLAFYWAALFQAAFALAWSSRPSPDRLATIGIAGNGLLLLAWGASRTVGLPVLAIGPEPVGMADGVAVLLELGIVGLLAVRRRGIGTIVARIAGPAVARTVATSGLVAIGSVAVLAAAVALAQPGAGHLH